MKNFILLLAFLPCLSYAQTSTSPRIGTGNSAGGAIIYQPLGTCNGCVALPVTPSGGTQAAPYAATPLGFGQQATFSTSTTLPAIPVGTICAVVAVETNPVRYRDDGVAPTATVGQLVTVGQPLSLCEISSGLSAVRFIPTTGSATIDVSFYK